MIATVFDVAQFALLALVFLQLTGLGMRVSRLERKIK
jgi:hypothetical protein